MSTTSTITGVPWSSYIQARNVARFATTRAERQALADHLIRAGALRLGRVDLTRGEPAFWNWVAVHHKLQRLLAQRPPAPKPHPQPARVPTVAELRVHWSTKLLAGHNPTDVPAEHLEALVLSDRRCARIVDQWHHQQRSRTGLTHTNIPRLW